MTVDLRETEQRQAGRELDAMIAERVMGWKVGRAGRTWFFTDPSDPIRTPRVPDYSSDIAAAFSVVEAMRAKGWDVSLKHIGIGWDVAFLGEWDGDKPQDDFSRGGYCAHGLATSDTLPLAICRASLDALANATPNSAVPDSHERQAGRP